MVYSLARRAFRRAAGSPAASGALEVGGGGFPVSGHGPGHWGASACEGPARRRLTRASSAPPKPDRGVDLAANGAIEITKPAKQSDPRANHCFGRGQHPPEKRRADAPEVPSGGRSLPVSRVGAYHLFRPRPSGPGQPTPPTPPPAARTAGLPGQKDPSSAMVVISREYHGADLRSRPLYRHPAARTQSCICLPKGCATQRGGAGIHGFMGAHEQPSFSELVQR
jgi:hypothetical protein